MNTNKLLQTIRSGWSPIVVIAVTTLAIIAISIYCLASGYFIIFQNLFYIPIIIACVYYIKRGFAFSVIIACLYFLLTLAFTRDPSILLQALVRVLIFVLVAGVITHLSLARKRVEQKLKEYSEQLEEMVAELTRELRQAQEQLVRKEKLAVLGQMAGSVGHELRNPLGVINTAVYYLKLVQPDVNEKIKQKLAMIEREVHNADKIIGDLLGFARVGSVEQEQVSVPTLVRQTLERFPVPAVVEVVLDLPDDLPMVFTDPRQVEQVLGNLTTNACQAMLEPRTGSSTGVATQKSSAPGVATGGELVISAKPLSVNGQSSVAIAVKDNGTGISPENMQKLFEPLFTTKAKGIGLGLAVSRMLAEANGGRIEVESEVGKGSTFTLVLPVVT